MKKYTVPVYFGSLHGVNDFIAGCLLAYYSIGNVQTEQVVLAYLLYSLIAFGGQLPVGWLLDIYQKPKPLIALCILLLALACLAAPAFIFIAILLSGIASALVHVGGGTVCFLQDTKSTVASGIFTAPGVLGLILGGLVGHSNSIMLLYFLLPVMALFFFILWKMKLPEYAVLDEKEQQPILETHDYIMLVLLLAIALRSMIWNVLHVLAEQHNTVWLLGIGIAAFSGKLFGGFITYKVDWKKYVFISVGVAAVLLSLGKDNLVVFCTGILLLQSAVPVTLWMMQQYLNKQPAAATALSLGIAIILAGLPGYLNEYRAVQQDKNILAASFVLLFILNGYWVFKTKRRKG